MWGCSTARRAIHQRGWIIADSGDFTKLLPGHLGPDPRYCPFPKCTFRDGAILQLLPRAAPLQCSSPTTGHQPLPTSHCPLATSHCPLATSHCPLATFLVPVVSFRLYSLCAVFCRKSLFLVGAATCLLDLRRRFRIRFQKRAKRNIKGNLGETPSVRRHNHMVRISVTPQGDRMWQIARKLSTQLQGDGCELYGPDGRMV